MPWTHTAPPDQPDPDNAESDDAAEEWGHD